MQIKLENKGNGLVMHLAGEMDASTAILVDREINRFFALALPNLWVDCNQLLYISSAGVGVFISHLQRFRDEKMNLVLFGLTPKIQSVFTVLGLDSLLNIKSNLETSPILSDFS